MFWLMLKCCIMGGLNGNTAAMLEGEKRGFKCSWFKYEIRNSIENIKHVYFLDICTNCKCVLCINIVMLSKTLADKYKMNNLYKFSDTVPVFLFY